MTDYRIAVLGLGFVGLPLAYQLSKHFHVLGFDLNQERIKSLKKNIDSNLDLLPVELAVSKLSFSDCLADLATLNVYIISVPTPLKKNRQPDLGPLIKVSKMLAPLLTPGDIVIYESSVFPGTTENICIPLLERGSQLKENLDFFVAYSPERINPGDKEHQLDNTVKLIAAGNPKTLSHLKNIYQKICVKTYTCSSIAVAEASKILENCQRDVNIALMNEMTTILHRLNIPSEEVFRAAASKYNYIPFAPGLVGGHCIPVDPAYLIFQAKQHGIFPRLLISARKVNDGMSQFIMSELQRLIRDKTFSKPKIHIGIFGLTYKPNVPDIRNSLVFKCLDEINASEYQLSLHDPLLPDFHYRDHTPTPFTEIVALDVVMLFVGHDFYRQQGLQRFIEKLNPNGIIMDIAHLFTQEKLSSNVEYWQL